MTQPQRGVPGLDTPPAKPQTWDEEVDCEHDHVEADDDGLYLRYHRCLDCGRIVILTEPDEDGKGYWEVID